MTTVADFGEYTDVNGVLSIGGVALADVQCDFSWERKSVTYERASKRSPIELPGSFSYNLTLKKALVRDDIPTTIVYSLTDATIGGTADAVLAATVFGAANAWTAAAKTMTTPSILSFELSVAAVTTAGTITIVGEDANANVIEETVAFPTTMLVGAKVYTTKYFSKTAGFYNNGVVSTGAGKIKIDGVAGGSTWTVGDPGIFDLDVELTKGAHTLKASIPDCWFKTGAISWSTGGEVLENPLSVAIHDFDEIEWSNS